MKKDDEVFRFAGDVALITLKLFLQMGLAKK